VKTAEKTRENLARRRLDRRGYRLMKSRARDPNDLTYDGYQITNLDNGDVIAGCGNADRGYALDLDKVEAWLNRKGRKSSWC
jgi:hypothetical protein